MQVYHRLQVNATVFGEYTVRYLREARLADSTRAMKASVIEREIAPVLGRLTRGQSDMNNNP